MNYDLRHQVWNKFDGKCKICQAELYEIEESTILDKIDQIKELPVYKWNQTCWKCSKTTPIVTYSFVLDYNKSIGDVPKLDAMLLTKYPFVNRIYSKTQRKEVTANTCIHCGSLQGNHFTGQSLMYIDNDNLEKKIDSILPIDFEQNDFDIDPGALEPMISRSSLVMFII